MKELFSELLKQDKDAFKVLKQKEDEIVKVKEIEVKINNGTGLFFTHNNTDFTLMWLYRFHKNLFQLDVIKLRVERFEVETEPDKKEVERKETVTYESYPINALKANSIFQAKGGKKIGRAEFESMYKRIQKIILLTPDNHPEKWIQGQIDF